MATQESDVPISEAETVQELNYLGFVRSLVAFLYSLALNLYTFVEQRSGPFKTLFALAEKADAAVLRPLLSKFASIGDDLLIFIDNRRREQAMMNIKYSTAWLFFSLLVKAVELYEVLVPTQLQTAIAEFTALLKSGVKKSIVFSEWVENAITTLVEKFKEVGIWGVISYIVQQTYQFLVSLYEKLLQIIISKFTELLLQALKIPSIQSLVSTAVPLATAAIQKYSSGLTTVLEGVATSAQAAAAVSSATDAVKDVTEAATATATGIVGGVTDALTGAVGALKG